jgi:hypothetical protein
MDYVPAPEESDEDEEEDDEEDIDFHGTDPSAQFVIVSSADVLMTIATRCCRELRRGRDRGGIHRNR